jgi:hypothetical protein
MRRQRTRQRRRARTRRRGGALVGKPYGPTTWSTANHYAYNRTPKLEYPAYNTHQNGGGQWYDMFDPRMRPVQPLWSIKDSAEHGLQSGVNSFMGKYPTVSPSPLMGHFQK